MPRQALDAGVGVIEAALRARGLYRDTVILFSTDNGGAGGVSNLPLRGHKESLYQGGVRGVAWVGGGLVQRRRCDQEKKK